MNNFNRRPGRALHAIVGHTSCQHLNYDLSCEEFAALIARAEARCEICRVQPEDTGHRKLHIDHDSRRGEWAVRGLICSPCNTSLDRWPIPPTPAESAFLQNPWVDHYHGSRVERGPEPAVGTTLACGNSRRIWTRSDVGWWPAARHGGVILSWEILNTWYAPHRMEAIETGVPPRMDPRVTADFRRLTLSRHRPR